MAIQIEDQEEDTKLNEIFNDEIKWYEDKKLEEEVISQLSHEDFSTCKQIESSIKNKILSPKSIHTKLESMQIGKKKLQ